MVTTDMNQAAFGAPTLTISPMVLWKRRIEDGVHLPFLDGRLANGDGNRLLLVNAF